MKAELSIVIPVYNRAGIVQRTLDSVHHQTLRPLDVILVDNNSTDNTAEMLSAWKEHVEGPGFSVKVVAETQPGAAAARNRGLREVDTPYMMFFDSDDLMMPRHAERALRALKAPDAPDIVGWDVKYLMLNNKWRRCCFFEKDYLWHNLTHGMMSTQRYAARTSIFHKAGGWNPEIRGWDDIELGTRILLADPKIVKLKGTPTVTVCSQAESITGEAYTPSSTLWERALDEIENSLARAGHPTEAVELQRCVLAGLYVAEGSPEEGIRLYETTIPKTPSRLKRSMLRFAFRYTALGGRGAARLLRPFFKI